MRVPHLHPDGGGFPDKWSDSRASSLPPGRRRRGQRANSERRRFAKRSLLLANPPADLSHDSPLTHSIVTSADQTPRDISGQMILCSCSCSRTGSLQSSTSPLTPHQKSYDKRAKKQQIPPGGQLVPPDETASPVKILPVPDHKLQFIILSQMPNVAVIVPAFHSAGRALEIHDLMDAQIDSRQGGLASVSNRTV